MQIFLLLRFCGKQRGTAFVDVLHTPPVPLARLWVGRVIHYTTRRNELSFLVSSVKLPRLAMTLCRKSPAEEFILASHQMWAAAYQGGLILPGCQVPTKAALSLPLLRQGRENITKDSWVEIRTGRDHSAITVTGKTDSGKN